MWIYRNVKNGQDGSAVVLALFVLALVGAFVALALTRTSTEAAATGNEAAEGRTMYAAQGSLEMMTRNFNKIFETKLNPAEADILKVSDASVPGLSDTEGGQFKFNQEKPEQTSQSRSETLSGGPYSGLIALRDNWRLRTTATDLNTRTQVQLTRNILNNRIPIFQFGVFYEDDLELYRPPRFSFGGRVHSNRHFFMSPGADGVYFDSRVTAAGHVVTQTWRNGNSGDSANNQTFIKNASGVNKQLLPTMGSVLNGTPNVFASGQWADSDMPSSKINPSFATQTAIFDGNLQAGVRQLKLPLKVGNDSADLIEMLRRGKSAASGGTGGDLYWNGSSVVPVTTAVQDGDIMKAERFANKTGIRVSLADSKAKLPGCASGSGTAAVSGACGVRLDGNMAGDGPVPSPSPAATPERARGYQPKPGKKVASDTTPTYIPTRVNGERLYTSGREVWIKVETVETDTTTGAIITKDITEDILSLGMTELAPSTINITSGYTGSAVNNGTATSPSSNLTATTAQTASTYPDSRSILKIQRWAIVGQQIPLNNNHMFSYGTAPNIVHLVRRYTGVNSTRAANGCSTTGCTAQNADPNGSLEHLGHMKQATVNGTADTGIVPFPIMMFDMREGLYFDYRDTSFYPTGTSPNFIFGTMGGTNQRVSANGVMSMIDVDVANLRRFLRGDYNGLLPTNTPFATAKGSGLANTDIPQKEGWVLYVSDRRGDYDFDGEFDMEDVYVNGDGSSSSLQKGEDINNNGSLDTRFCSNSSDTACEAERYRTRTVATDTAAVVDHKYYRRGVRLINGTVLPGIYSAATPSNTRGFTVASENGVYVQGNYNATGVTSRPSTGNTPYNNYLPFDTAVHIPASVVADGVTILSNAWNDAKSFAYPYDLANREAADTTIRFAMIAGDTISSKYDPLPASNTNSPPNQGGISPGLNGGVHNFKRFLERWTNPSNSSFKINLDYAGSLINLYNSRNASGSFKCCNMVYNPPIRNWVFDSTFLDPTRLPPGSPFFQYIQTTGFERTNN